MHTNKRGYIGNAIAELPNGALVILWGGITIGFAFVYFFIGLISPEHGPTINHFNPILEQFFDCLYFSIVTATSVGFGDIVPQGFSKMLVSIQSIASLSTFAILVTKLVSQKQEHFTENLYRLTNEESTHTILDEFHLVRQDIDILLEHLTHSHKLSDPAWHDFDVAIARVQAAFLDIPKLYATQELVTLSERRENLLLEGAERTLMRIQQFFHALQGSTVNLPPDTISNINEFLIQSKKLVEEWENSVGKNNQSSLEDLRQTIRHIEEHVRKM